MTKINIQKNFGGSNSKGLSKCVRVIGSLSHRSSVITKKKSCFWHGTVSLCYDKLMPSTVSLSSKNIYSFRKFSKTTASEYLFGIFKHSLQMFFRCFLFFILEIRGWIVTVRSICIMFDSSDIYF